MGAVMTKESPLPTHKAVVTASVGLHARPAAVFVRAVTDTGLPVTIAKAGIPGVDARSLLQVMTADFHQGCEVELGISESVLEAGLSREEAQDALTALAVLLESQGAA
jgi:phosphocarrier protein HPr